MLLARIWSTHLKIKRLLGYNLAVIRCDRTLWSVLVSHLVPCSEDPWDPGSMAMLLNGFVETADSGPSMLGEKRSTVGTSLCSQIPTWLNSLYRNAYSSNRLWNPRVYIYICKYITTNYCSYRAFDRQSASSTSHEGPPNPSDMTPTPQVIPMTEIGSAIAGCCGLHECKHVHLW